MVLNLGVAIWTSADVMTFFCFLLGFGRNLDICGYDDLFLLFTRFWAENWTSADVMTFLALHLMRNCIYVCLMTCNIGRGVAGGGGGGGAKVEIAPQKYFQ